MTRQRNQQGCFITLEGIDGSGKTTQVDLLCQHMEAASIPFVRTREPGGTPIGDAIRALLLDPASVMTAHTEAYLYAASRAEHVRQVVLPALQAGMVVICDRYLDASVAYQGYGMADHGLTADTVLSINKHAVEGVIPDLTCIIDVKIEVAKRRLQESGRALFGGRDRIESRGDVFFERVREGLRAVRDRDSERILWLDGEMAPSAIHERIWAKVHTMLEKVGDSTCD